MTLIRTQRIAALLLVSGLLLAGCDEGKAPVVTESTAITDEPVETAADTFRWIVETEPEKVPVSLSVQPNVDSDDPTLYLFRKNVTVDQDIYFSNAARLEYLDGETWTGCPNSEAMSADTTFQKLGPNEYERRFLPIAGIDFSRDGTYRVITAYNLTGNAADNVEVKMEFKLGVNNTEYFKHTAPLVIDGKEKTVTYRFFGPFGTRIQFKDGVQIQEFVLYDKDGNVVPAPHVLLETSQYGDTKKQIMLFDSAQYLDALKGYCWDSEWKRTMKQYDESYFDDHVLLLAQFRVGSGSFYHLIDSITVETGSLFIDVIQDSLSDQVTADEAYPMLLIELDRADIDKCTAFDMKITSWR